MRSGHGVEALTTPRMAPTDPPKSQPQSTSRPMSLYRLDRIRRTRRRISARRRQPGRNCSLIEANDSDQELREHKPSTTVATSPSSIPKSAPYADRRARNMTSRWTPAPSNRGSATFRPISRRRRFTRLRSTMRWPCLGTMSPSRECETGEAVKKTSRFFVLFRSPRSSSPRISEPSRMRASRRRPSPRDEIVSTTCRRS